MADLFVGLMSGTSLDGVDAVLARFGPADADAGGQHAGAAHQVRVLAHQHQAFPDELRDTFLQLNSPGGVDELHRASMAANSLAELCAGLVLRLLHTSGHDRSEVHAIGAHGQTVRHRPVIEGRPGYTLQLNQPALLAEQTGISVVADFRSRDVAAGGQGAPLVPAFHRAIFGRLGRDVALLNLGGISNLTLLGADGHTGGFDCGPANVLMDLWCEQQLGRRYDAQGAWAASGQPVPELLSAMRAEPYFQLPPPKSTGRDLFHAQWLADHLSPFGGRLAAQDVQSTLCELTALTCADALKVHAPRTTSLMVCGGGALNNELMRRLRALLPEVLVEWTDAHGLPAMQVEAAAFAWLAWAHVRGQAGNLPEVTGAQGPRILGAWYPA